MEVNRKKMQRLHIRQQKQRDCLLARQADLLASVEPIQNKAKRHISSQDTAELAARGRNTRANIQAAASTSSLTFRTPRITLCMQ